MVIIIININIVGSSEFALEFLLLVLIWQKEEHFNYHFINMRLLNFNKFIGKIGMFIIFILN